MHFSVVCSEDAPRIAPGRHQSEAAGTFIGVESAEWRMKVCDSGLAAGLNRGYYETAAIRCSRAHPLRRTGPGNSARLGRAGRLALEKFPARRDPRRGHSTVANGCAMKLIRDFLNQGSAANLESDCVAASPPASVFLGPSGPDPQGVSKP